MNLIINLWVKHNEYYNTLFGKPRIEILKTFLFFSILQTTGYKYSCYINLPAGRWENIFQKSGRNSLPVIHQA